MFFIRLFRGILIIFVLLIAFSYFDLLEAGELLPDKCGLGPEFECTKYKLSYSINGAGIAKIQLKNSLGQPIILQSIKLALENLTNLQCAEVPMMPLEMGADVVKEFLWEECDFVSAGLIENEKGKVLMTIRFYLLASSPSYSREITGDIISIVS